MAEPTSTRAERVLRLTRELGVLRARDLARHGIAREHLSRLTADGRLTRVGRGLYMLPDADLTEHHSLAEVAKRVPAGIVCLLSALRFHNLTTQAPFEIWLALPPSVRRPRLDWPPLRVMRFSGPALTEGVEEHIVEGVPVRIYGVAKTVADTFRYRNKIGLDVALEALRETWRERRATMDELWHAAKVCHISTVMLPYMTALASLEEY